MRNILRTILALIILSAILALFGCGKKAEKPKVKGKTTQETTTPTTEKLTKTFTDDDFIEYWAQISYLTEKYAQNPNPIQYGQDLKKVYEKLGITEKETDAFSKKYEEWLATWTQRAASNPEKFGKEWEALWKKYEKRVEELKAGK